jgi:hypothetical protein
MDEGSVSIKDYVDARDHELGHRLDESAHDRQLIRDELTGLVRVETFQLAIDRIGALERQLARVYGGLVVVVALLSLAGVLAHYLYGP